jgi:hypothetical protein
MSCMLILMLTMRGGGGESTARERDHDAPAAGAEGGVEGGGVGVEADGPLRDGGAPQRGSMLGGHLRSCRAQGCCNFALLPSCTPTPQYACRHACNLCNSVDCIRKLITQKRKTAQKDSKLDKSMRYHRWNLRNLYSIRFLSAPRAATAGAGKHNGALMGPTHLHHSEAEWEASLKTRAPSPVPR